MRPSDLLGPRVRNDPWVAWCVDEAVFLWGAYVENQLEEAAHDDKKKKSKETAAAEARVQRRMKELMTPPRAEAEVPKGTFRDPAAMMKAKKGG